MWSTNRSIKAREKTKLLANLCKFGKGEGEGRKRRGRRERRTELVSPSNYVNHGTLHHMITILQIPL